MFVMAHYLFFYTAIISDGRMCLLDLDALRYRTSVT